MSESSSFTNSLDKHLLGACPVPDQGPETREKYTEKGSNSENTSTQGAGQGGCSQENRQEERQEGSQARRGSPKWRREA